ncbi:hypothetical protein ACW0US_22510 [Xanthomonas euvesicatoria]
MSEKSEDPKKNLKCGLVMPISAIDGLPESHWVEVRAIVSEALADTEFSVLLVSDSNEIGIIQKRIVQNLYDNDIIICDVSAKNPNVMFELGMRLAFDKPAIIIKDDKTDYSFDTSPIEHLQYPRDLHYPSIKAFKTKLREKVLATHEASKSDTFTTFLKHFGEFVVAKIDEKPVGKEDFLLASMSELRQEVQVLTKSVKANPYRPKSHREVVLEPLDINLLDAATEFALSKAKESNNPKSFLSGLYERKGKEFLELSFQFHNSLGESYPHLSVTRDTSTRALYAAIEMLGPR